MGSDILVGIDGTTQSHDALAWAVEEARVRGVRVRVVHCWSYLGIGGSGQVVGTTEGDATAALVAAADSLAEDQRRFLDLVPINDLPVPGLLAEATTAAMVVVGSRARSGVKDRLVRSVSRAVVEQSMVPVVVVPCSR